jgi:hypothetical protein
VAKRRIALYTDAEHDIVGKVFRDPEWSEWSYVVYVKGESLGTGYTNDREDACTSCQEVMRRARPSTDDRR